MLGKQDELHVKLKNARLAIERLFLDQCQYGQQSKNLDPQWGLKTCGQFVGKEAKQSPQWGIHGTAAALRVLAVENSPEGQEVVRELVSTLNVYWGLLPAPDGFEPRDGQSSDQNNVIKISEVILGLLAIRPMTTDARRLADHLAQRLLDGRIEDKGWDYFVDDTKESCALLPTCYAVYALSECRSAHDLNGPKGELRKHLRSFAHGQGDAAMLPTYVCTLFVLTFNAHHPSREEMKELRGFFDSLWESARVPLRLAGTEQNIEYDHATEILYVRIPWQLYLLALAAKLRPYRRLGSVAAKERLQEIIKSAANGGFKYSQSGSRVSSRTNGILYEVLRLIDTEITSKQLWFVDVLGMLDKARNALGSRNAQVAYSVVAMLVGSIAVLGWLNDANHSVKDLAPDILASVMLGAAALGKK
ncbi:hypothetical protein B7486_08005 [cyanobacterium TDX16]|nr:hypothetical protein B7486_08005 [cyanobacterium TDX16]